MDILISTFIIPVLAVCLDLLLGDPKKWPHPVRLVGKGLELYEMCVRKAGIPLRGAGWCAVLLFAGAAWGGVVGLVQIPYIGVILAVYFSYAGLALGCLLREAETVVSLLDYGSIAEARRELSMLVSRETSGLDEEGVRRTLAETVSENLNDGFVAPLFYLALFGPGGMWAYKAVSTMDSMWGYKTDRYAHLGRGAAKTDDLLAWLPARITAQIMLFAGRRLGLAHSLAENAYKADAAKMESPNAGWPMAAAAWLVHAQMGGPTVYFGKVKDKPVLGPVGEKWDTLKMRNLLQLSSNTGAWAAWLLIPILGGVRWLL